MNTESVSEINQKFYDSIADVYDQIDSRRSGEEEHVWLKNVLEQIKQELNDYDPDKTVFLDAGAGSGFLSYRAQDMFNNLILLDISQKMLDRIDIPKAQKIQGDCAKIPLENNSVDVIGAFATLHHLYNPEEFFAEAQRILKPGGILYTDHDIEERFIAKFKYPLKLYRAIFDHGHGYLKACPNLSQEDYEITEYHGNSGLNARKLAAYLESNGFEVLVELYHWQGMGSVAKIVELTHLDKVLKSQGFAPVFRLIAKKK